MIQAAETIVAISSPAGSGAMALIRMSGEQALSLLHGIFIPMKGVFDAQKQKSHQLRFGRIVDGQRVIDEVLVSFFRSPNSYTGENLVEISCHGSVYIQQEILALLVRRGARLAQPGEFTQRAFLNGKMDLSQAEAVADLIASSNRGAHKLAMNQMRGGFARELTVLREQMLQFVSLMELELDFAEEDVEFADRARLSVMIEDLLAHLNSLIHSFSIGNAVKNGIPVAIVGETNVGKSTLLNALLKEEKAIVSEIAGTTRDVIEDCIHIEGIEFRFIDTAGLRHTDDSIENIGIERSYQQIQKAQIVLLVVDPTAADTQSKRWVTTVTEKLNNDQKLIILVNKADLDEQSAHNRQQLVNSLSMKSYHRSLLISA